MKPLPAPRDYMKREVDTYLAGTSHMRDCEIVAFGVCTCKQYFDAYRAALAQHLGPREAIAEDFGCVTRGRDGVMVSVDAPESVRVVGKSPLLAAPYGEQ